jgi:hypothetical protein
MTVSTVGTTFSATARFDLALVTRFLGVAQPSSRFETVAQHADEKEGNSEHPAIMF